MLDFETFKEEFAHTILHGYSVMDDIKLGVPKEGKKGVLEEKIVDFKMSDFAPKVITKSQFDNVFNKYLDHLNNAHGKPGAACNAHDKRMSTITEKDDSSEGEAASTVVEKD